MSVTTPRRASPRPEAAAATAGRAPLLRPSIVVATSAILLLCALTVLAIRVSRPIGGRGAAGIAGTAPAGDALARARAVRLAVVPEVDSRIFEVTEATGRVEARRDGKWVLIVAGDVLTQDDVVRSGVGRAILRRGSTEIELRDRVEIRLDSISRAGTSVDLRRGRVVAHVGRSGGNMAITAARTRTANEGDAPSRFVVTADERGRVSVATTEGTARFEAGGRVVKVAAGRASRAEPDQPPSEPETISEDVFLTVAWPPGERREQKAVVVSGRADADAIVHVNGTAAEIDRGGHFAASVPVRIGANPIQVEVEDISGRVKRETREVRKIPTTPPQLTPIPTELWNK